MDANNGTGSPRTMRALRILGLATVLACAYPAHSQECSGGIGGGTDATGNECSDSVAVAQVGTGRSTAAPSSLPKAEQSLAPNRVVAGAGTSSANSPGAAPMGAAARHRKQVFDERRARFNDEGHARVAGSSVTMAP